MKNRLAIRLLPADRYKNLFKTRHYIKIENDDTRILGNPLFSYRFLPSVCYAEVNSASCNRLKPNIGERHYVL